MFLYVIYVKPTLICEMESVVSDMVGEKVSFLHDVPAFTLQSNRELTADEKQALMIGNKDLQVSRVELVSITT
jgi:hypothetical protein